MKVDDNQLLPAPHLVLQGKDTPLKHEGARWPGEICIEGDHLRLNSTKRAEGGQSGYYPPHRLRKGNRHIAAIVGFSEGIIRTGQNAGQLSKDINIVGAFRPSVKLLEEDEIEGVITCNCFFYPGKRLVKNIPWRNNHLAAVIKKVCLTAHPGISDIPG